MDINTELQPRKFDSITRAVYTIDLGDGPVTFHTLDAIACDGTAWWKLIAPTDEHSTGWQRQDDLPPRQWLAGRMVA